MGRTWSRKEPVENLAADDLVKSDKPWQLPEIPEIERKNRYFSAEISWWIGAKTDGFTALALTQVERMRPRAHMVPDSNLSY